MSKEIKLKPCPFCGGKAKLLKDEIGNTADMCGAEWWYVACSKLDCGIYAETADRPTPQEAAKLWNRRVGERWPE